MVSVPFADVEGDLGTVIAIDAAAAESDPALDVYSLVSPGLFLHVGLWDSPFVFALGGQFAPRATQIDYTGTDGTTASRIKYTDDGTTSTCICIQDGPETGNFAEVSGVCSYPSMQDDTALQAGQCPI